MSELFRQELEAFERHKAELLAQAHGKWVLIKGDRIVGIFEDRLSAARRGYAEFPAQDFLTKRIVEVEPPKLILHAARS